MKNLLTTALALCLALGAAAQTPDSTQGYRFTEGKILRTTPVKDQSRSGTCWCYSTMTMLESEILRAGGPEMHLSEMWIVRHSFMDKGEKYVRLHGKLNFAEGGASHDVTEGIKRHGIVPFEVYPGLNYGTEKPDFHEISAVLKAYLDAVIEARRSPSPRPGNAVSTPFSTNTSVPCPSVSPTRARSIPRRRLPNRFQSAWTTTSISPPSRTTPSTNPS